MAVREWQDVDGDWTNTANWSDATVPVTDDDVVIGSGTQDITTNIDQNTVSLASLKVGENYTGKIGTSSSKLIINATDFNFSGMGTSNYVKGEFVTVTVIDGATSTTMLDIEGYDGSTPIDTDGITTLRVLGGRGTVNISAGALAAIEMIGATRATVTVESDVTALATIVIDSGDVETATNIATKATCYGGTLTVTGSATAAEIELYDGGSVDYNSSGTITTLDVFGGTFSLLDNTAASVTITNSTMYEGSTLRLDNALQNVTLANPMTVQGGDLRLPPGSQITLG
tara:strand:+ start:505 stop:1362 length:858 start_codon:yes stop_codon:yes gene_type:complete